MFQKVLIAEDHGLTGTGLRERLLDLSIPEIEVVHYCDDALLRIKVGIQQGSPFEILITDLSFKEDHRARKLTSGEALITETRKLLPNIKILVHSVEHRIGKIRALYNHLQIDGFVGKERRDFNEIHTAITTVFEGNTYIPESLRQGLRSAENQMKLNEQDIYLLELLAKGFKQEEIAHYFKRRNYSGSSLRSIQDRLGKLKIIFGAKNPIHLVARALEQGFI